MSNGKIVVGVKKNNPDAAPNTGKGLRAEKLLESAPASKLFGIDLFKFSASDAPFAGLKPPEKKEFLENGSMELMKLSGKLERTAFISIANEAVEMKKITDRASKEEWIRLFSASAAKASGLGAILNVVYESTEHNVYTHVAIQKMSHFISTSLVMKFTDDEKGANNAGNALLIAESYCRCGKDEKFAKHLFEGLFSCEDEPRTLAEWIGKYR